MAQGAWHGLRGPADFIIPDNTREWVYSGVASAATAAASYVLNSREVTRSLSRVTARTIHSVYAANPGAIYPRAALRAAAQREVVRGSVLRGAGFILRAVPVVGLTVTALSVVYSIPPSGQTWSDVMAANPQWTVNPFTGELNPHHG